MILFLLGIIDLAGSILLFLSLARLPSILGIGLYLAIFLILKGLYSIPLKSYFAAVVDILSALFLLLSFGHIYIHYTLVILFGILLLAKSMQSLIPELL